MPKSLNSANHRNHRGRSNSHTPSSRRNGYHRRLRCEVLEHRHLLSIGTGGDGIELFSTSPSDVAQAFPYSQDFASGDLSTLEGWSFSATGTGTWAVTDANSPHGGTYALQASQTSEEAATQDAILKLDLSGQVGRTDLEVDFWAKHSSFLQPLGNDSSTILYVGDSGNTIQYLTGNDTSLYVSGDGSTWTAVSGGRVWPTTIEYMHYAFDLDQALSSAGIVLDSDV